MGKKTKQDPTGQATNRRRSTRRLDVRLTTAQRKIRALFREVPKTRRTVTKIQNAEKTAVYDYEIDDQEQQQLENSVVFIVNDELLETQTGQMPFDWHWKKDVELPYRQGTVEEVNGFNTLVAGATIAGVLVGGLPPQPVEIEQVLMSDIYRKRVASAQVTNFQSIKTLSERTSAQVIQRINAGMQAGDSPRAIAKQISERFDVAKSSAKRIADTEINKAYNDARLDATNMMAEQTGLRAGVIHISALMATTREHHAARHGNAYTVDDQLQWWNQGANRINCHCTTRTVLLNSKGQVVDTELQVEIKEERKFFDS